MKWEDYEDPTGSEAVVVPHLLTTYVEFVDTVLPNYYQGVLVLIGNTGSRTFKLEAESLPAAKKEMEQKLTSIANEVLAEVG